MQLKKLKKFFSELISLVIIFLKKQESHFGKMLCEKYGNYDDFIKSYKPKMKYRAEKSAVCINGMTFHIPYRMLSTGHWFVFNYPNAQPTKRNKLIDTLWSIQGVKNVDVMAYKITVDLGELFSFDEEMKTKILYVIEKYAPESIF